MGFLVVSLVWFFCGHCFVLVFAGLNYCLTKSLGLDPIAMNLLICVCVNKQKMQISYRNWFDDLLVTCLINDFQKDGFDPWIIWQVYFDTSSSFKSALKF